MENVRIKWTDYTSSPAFTQWGDAEFGGKRRCFGVEIRRKARVAWSGIQIFRLMAAAMQAAPKPLSMLTTASPGEQLVSMPSRAEKPPAPAP